MSESEIPEADTPSELPTSFDQLGLREEVLASVKAAGFETPTPIQALFIPESLKGTDVLGQAQTGTGKTAAFLLPIFHLLKPGEASPAALILAPTRELAIQIEGEVKRLGANLGFSAITIYGGSSYEPQIAALAKGVDIVVGTPGRIMDHINAGRLNLKNVKIAVLDEADRMLDLGFRKDIEFILRRSPDHRQTLLLSATIADDIQKLSKRFMKNAKLIWTSPEKMTVDSVEQFFSVVASENKWPMLLKILDEERPSLAIIFCRTKREARRLALRLNDVFINAREIHGDLVQTKREKIMNHFRKGNVQILVATDVASRGIDVDNISHIFNYDIPQKSEDYVHRIGRTGRMNRTGRAFTLLNKEEAPFLTDIELLINHQLDQVSYDTLESRFWPNPPKEALPEFASGANTPQLQKDDYITNDKDQGRKGKAGRGDRSSGGRSSRPRSKRQDSGDAVQVTCSTCKVETTVFFKPDPKRPIYCRDCYAKAKASKKPSKPRQAEAPEK